MPNALSATALFVFEMRQLLNEPTFHVEYIMTPYYIFFLGLWNKHTRNNDDSYETHSLTVRTIKIYNCPDSHLYSPCYNDVEAISQNKCPDKKRAADTMTQIWWSDRYGVTRKACVYTFPRIVERRRLC